MMASSTGRSSPRHALTRRRWIRRARQRRPHLRGRPTRASPRAPSSGRCRATGASSSRATARRVKYKPRAQRRRGAQRAGCAPSRSRISRSPTTRRPTCTSCSRLATCQSSWPISSMAPPSSRGCRACAHPTPNLSTAAAAIRTPRRRRGRAPSRGTRQARRRRARRAAVQEAARPAAPAPRSATRWGGSRHRATRRLALWPQGAYPRRMTGVRHRHQKRGRPPCRRCSSSLVQQNALRRRRSLSRPRRRGTLRGLRRTRRAAQAETRPQRSAL
mmetsp:Transcript_67444/g.201505  ORF Transcript_67444/g.201505 Transcript_67444/m.201505 type:complete len:274 (+) Transcript_67444:889-1710(+)